VPWVILQKCQSETSQWVPKVTPELLVILLSFFLSFFLEKD